jgi:signal transduction histidine kinase
MLHMIDQMLVLAQVRQTDVETQLLDIGVIVSEAQKRLSAMCASRKATIKAPTCWPGIIGDQLWVEEVWVNLMSNAIKYGGDPPIVELGSTLQPDGMVQLWVRDNGPGLSPQEQARLFKPFERLNRTEINGHGLGLSIVRRIIEKLGGTVGVASTLGQGSRFYFTLPRAPVE